MNEEQTGAEHRDFPIRLPESRWFRYLSRVLILYIFSLIFKSFDLSFINEVGRYSFRPQVFSLNFVLLGLLVWEGASWLTRIVERTSVHASVFARLVLICCALAAYGILSAYLFAFVYAVTDIWLYHEYEAWRHFRAMSYDMIFGIFMFYVIAVCFNGIILYYKRWKEYQLQTERLMRENIQAKYDALRNQIEPHFFFNSLSVLTNLVYKSADLSAEYITQLAKIYRYILDKKFENLVSIQTELDFLESYLFLISIRHHNSIVFSEEIGEEVREQGMIPPATLQMLVENAIKHNRFSSNDPLKITVKSANGFLLISNPLKRKTVREVSPGIGLENIRKRYELASNSAIAIEETDGFFIVKIPVIQSP